VSGYFLPGFFLPTDAFFVAAGLAFALLATSLGLALLAAAFALAGTGLAGAALFDLAPDFADLAKMLSQFFENSGEAPDRTIGPLIGRISPGIDGRVSRLFRADSARRSGCWGAILRQGFWGARVRKPLDPPIDQSQAKTELLNALIVNGVPCRQNQPVANGDSGDQRINAPDR